MSKIEDVNFINNFSKIKLSEICRNLKVDRTNIFYGRCSDKKIHEVRKQIEHEIAMLYILDGVENGK